MADAPKPLYSKRYLAGIDSNCGIFWEFLRKTGRISE
jgi:hypothetical protein